MSEVSSIRQVGDTSVPLILTIEKEGVGGVTGKSPTVALRNAAGTTSYLDWNDNTFKTSGWTTKYASMTEVERGHYQRILNSSLVSAIVAGFKVAAEYHVDDGSGTIGDALDVILFVEEIHDVATEGGIAAAVWDEVLSSTSHFTSGTAGELLQIVKGLVQQNFFIDNTAYNSSGLLTTARIRIFQTKAATDLATDGGSSQGEIATFDITTVAESGNAGQIATYKATRVS